MFWKCSENIYTRHLTCPVYVISCVYLQEHLWKTLGSGSISGSKRNMPRKLNKCGNSGPGNWTPSQFTMMKRLTPAKTSWKLTIKLRSKICLKIYRIYLYYLTEYCMQNIHPYIYHRLLNKLTQRTFPSIFTGKVFHRNFNIPIIKQNWCVSFCCRHTKLMVSYRLWGVKHIMQFHPFKATNLKDG